MELYGEVLTSAQCALFILIICSILKWTGKRAWKYLAWVLIMYSEHDKVHYQYTSQHSHTQSIELHAYNQWSYKSHDIISSITTHHLCIFKMLKILLMQAIQYFVSCVSLPTIYIHQTVIKHFANAINSTTPTHLAPTKTSNIKEVNMYMCWLCTLSIVSYWTKVYSHSCTHT